MGDRLEFPGNPGDERDEKDWDKPRHMEDGKFYDLRPPSTRTGKIFDKVQCEYQVPGKPDEYVVRGIPRGSTKVQSFVLIFSGLKGVTITETDDERFTADSEVQEHPDSIN